MGVTAKPKHLLRSQHRTMPLLQMRPWPGMSCSRTLCNIFSWCDLAHGMQVRMARKGVLKSIVPWVDARRVLAMRLRRRLAEDAVRAHVASADPSMHRAQALQLIETWYTGMVTDDRSGLRTAEKHDSAAESDATLTCARDGSTAHALYNHHELISQDRQFLDWLNSAHGAAKIGAELKKLKRHAAAATVMDVTKSQEGQEGLLMALENLLETNLSLKARVASMIGS